jgi:hypothetical protein
MKAHQQNQLIPEGVQNKPVRYLASPQGKTSYLFASQIS